MTKTTDPLPVLLSKIKAGFSALDRAIAGKKDWAEINPYLNQILDSMNTMVTFLGTDHANKSETWEEAGAGLMTILDGVKEKSLKSFIGVFVRFCDLHAKIEEKSTP